MPPDGDRAGVERGGDEPGHRGQPHMGGDQPAHRFLTVPAGRHQVLVGHREGALQRTATVDPERDDPIDQLLAQAAQRRRFVVRHPDPLTRAGVPAVTAAHRRRTAGWSL